MARIERARTTSFWPPRVLGSGAMPLRREWVRKVDEDTLWISEVDGRLIVSDAPWGAVGRRGRSRGLTRAEELGWRLLRRAPRHMQREADGKPVA